MKTKDIICLIGAFVFSYLFFKQGWGINYLLFSLFITASLAIATLKATKHKAWWLSVSAVFIAAVCTVLYGNTLSVITLYIAWMLLSGFTINPKASATVIFAQSGFSFLTSMATTIKGWRLAANRRNAGKKQTNMEYWYVYLLILGIVLLFIILYNSASQSFSQVLQKIDLSFISFPWIFFTLLGYYITTVLIRNRRIKGLEKEENQWASPLIALLPPYSDEFLQRQQIERRAGGLLLLLLNLLLLVVNIADINFLSQGINNPSALNFSQIVHQGIGSLITSIVFAVAILLYIFRGQLNFDSKAKTIYLFALLWILQNLLLIATNGIKNGLYIHYVDGLTYKRIGVFYYLVLAAVGLAVTAYKLYAKKTNWYLVRTNFVLFFGVMVISCTINWDVFIARYNINKAIADGKDPDAYYIASLSPNTLPYIAQWAESLQKDANKLKNYNTIQYNELIRNWKYKTNDFLSKENRQGWQSWNYNHHITYQKLQTVSWDDYCIYEIEFDTPTQENQSIR